MIELTQSRWSRLPRYVLFSTLFLSLFIVPFLLFGQSIEAFAKSQFDGRLNDGAAMLLAGTLLAADPVLPTPSSIVATLLAAKVGFVPAAIVNALALSLACIFGYWLGRGGSRTFSLLGRRLPAGFANWVQKYGLVAVLLCRPVPVLAEASLILAGAANHKPGRLLAWCCVTQTALGTAYAYSGSGWGEGRWDDVALFTGAVLIPIAGAVVVAISLLLSRIRPVADAD